jgi:hypothetical protein
VCNSIALSKKLSYELLLSFLAKTFYDCFCLQEKLKGKHKSVPRLLGITKESVVRVDENTKEVSVLRLATIMCIGKQTVDVFLL